MVWKFVFYSVSWLSNVLSFVNSLLVVVILVFWFIFLMMFGIVVVLFINVCIGEGMIFWKGVVCYFFEVRKDVFFDWIFSIILIILILVSYILIEIYIE